MPISGGPTPPPTSSIAMDKPISITPPIFFCIKAAAQMIIVQETARHNIPVIRKFGTMVVPGSPPILVAIGPCAQE